MIRLAAASLVILILTGPAVLAQEPQPQPNAAPQPEEPVELIEATKEEIWTLGDQQWDFKDVATAYHPVKGLLNPKTGIVEWTLEIVKELAAGEVGIHENTEGSPFKSVLLDEEKIALSAEPPVRLASKLTGKPGDKVKIVLALPRTDVLSQVKHVRIERRTKIGF